MEKVITTCLLILDKANLPHDVKYLILNQYFSSQLSLNNSVDRDLALYLRHIFHCKSLRGQTFLAVKLKSGYLFPVLEMPGLCHMKNVTNDLNLIRKKFNVGFHICIR